MSIQLKIWKRLIANRLTLSGYCPSIPISPLPSFPFNGKHHMQFANFCNQVATLSTTPPYRGVVVEFLISNCGLTEEDITKAFRHCTYTLRKKSTQNLEEVFELLKGCGLSIPVQFRKVVLRNPKLLFHRSENVKSKLSFFRTFMKKKDMSRLILKDAVIFDSKEDKLTSSISLLQRLGFEGEALSHLVAKTPRVLKTSEEKIMESFELMENLGFKKGSKLFAVGVNAILGLGKEKVERKLHFLSCLGLSKEDISVLSSRDPRFLALKEETLKRKVDFMVNSLGLPMTIFVTYSPLFSYSLEKRIIPRYRVIEALKYLQVEELKGKRPYPQIFLLSDKIFFKKYINEYAEPSILWDIYHGL